MKSFLILFLILPAFTFAENTPPGFSDFSSYLCQKFDYLKNNPQSNYRTSWSKADAQRYVQQNNANLKGHKKHRANGLAGNTYGKIVDAKQGDDRNYLVNQTMTMLGMLSTSLLSLSGTTGAPQASAQLETQSSQLSAVAQILSQPQTVTNSNGTQTIIPADPANAQTLQTAATNLNTEANALESGDTPTATTAAANISSANQAYVSPTYVPPSNSTATLESIASVLETIGTVVLTAYFGPAGAAAGTAFNSLLNGVVFNQTSSIAPGLASAALQSVPSLLPKAPAQQVTAPGSGVNVSQAGAAPAQQTQSNSSIQVPQAPAQGTLNSVNGGNSGASGTAPGI